MVRRPRIGVSACLLGQAVRWDGGDKRDRFVVEELAAVAELVPVCPEVELGMGVPREPIQLVRADRVRLLGRESGRDHTEAMERFAEARVAQLAAMGLDGYVLKADSPSCGRAGVAVRSPTGEVTRDGVGAFAKVLAARLPGLPLVDERELADPEVRRAFVERIRQHQRR